VYEGDVGAEEPDTLDPADEAGLLEIRTEEPLVKRSDLAPSFEVRPIEADEITVLGKWSGESLAAAIVPAIHQLLVEGADGSLFGEV